MLSNTPNRINQHQPSAHVQEGLLGQETIDGGERGQYVKPDTHELNS